MDTNDHVVSNLQSCLFYVLVLFFLLPKWTNKKWKKEMWLHVIMHMEVEYLKRADTLRRKHSSHHVKFGYTEGSF